MKQFVLKAFALTFLFVLTSCAEGGPKDVTEEIRNANVEFMAAFDAHDAARLTAVYSSDATLYPPNSDAISGSENIQAYWQAGFDAGIGTGKIETDSATAYGDTAIENGTFEIYAADGSLIDKGKFIGIWKNVAGEWKFYNDIWNSSMPLPEPPTEMEMTEEPAEESAEMEL
jgi:ketosteroid isomerase-like protein